MTSSAKPAPEDLSKPTKQAESLPAGYHTITPYIIVRPAAQFMEFLKTVFDGIERLRMPAPDGSIMHAEVAIGNGAIEVSDGNEEYPTGPAAIHLYVDDADATYERALRAGATSIAPVADQPWGDRWGAAKDQFGNALAALSTYNVNVSVVSSVALTGIPGAAARRIDVTVTRTPNVSVTLSGYRTSY